MLLRRRMSVPLTVVAVVLGCLSPAAASAQGGEKAVRPHSAVHTTVDRAAARQSAGGGALVAPTNTWTKARFTLRARVPWRAGLARTPRPVRLQMRRSSGWVTVARARVGRARSWTAVASAGTEVGVRRLRVLAPRHRRQPRWVSPAVSVRVVARATMPILTPPPPNESGGASQSWDAPENTDPEGAVGRASDWSWVDSNRRPAWRTCKVIRWAYDPTASYGDSLREVKRAFARVSGVSGLRFRYVGDADQLRRSQYDIGLSWSAASSFDPGVIGLTVFSYTIGGGSPSRITSAEVTFNSALALTIGIEPPPGGMATGQLFQHEIMHAVGLGHAGSNTQLMYPRLNANNPRFGAGDRAGLAAVGNNCSA